MFAIGAACSSTSPTAVAKPTGDGGAVLDSGASLPTSGFVITVSGEAEAKEGFPKSNKHDGDPPAFVEGWSLSYKHVIVTVANVRLSTDPEKNPANPKDVGAVVATASGPFAVDLAIGGDIPGKSGEPDERATKIAELPTTSSGAPFDLASRYAFSYDFVSATEGAQAANLDAESSALYEQAKANAWAMVFQGSATYEGPEPLPGSVFAKMPKTVDFTFGLKNPASYLNCENTDLAQVGDAYPRGVQAAADKATVVQITLHTDHLIWPKLNVEEGTLHFDPFAAVASTYGAGGDAGAAAAGLVTTAELDALDFTQFKTKASEIVPWRSNVSSWTAPMGDLAFEANGTNIPMNRFSTYLGYTAASGGHMNANGECEIETK